MKGKTASTPSNPTVDGTFLVRLARAAMTTYLNEGIVLQQPEKEWLQSRRGVFVTLRKKGELRGCIGYPEPILPLGEAVIRAAIAAAVEDPRFPPVTPNELPSLTIEVSVLTPLEPVTDPLSIQVGRDGLLIERGRHRGLLLPDVPLEYGWDRETFLAHTCLKAGMEPDAWRDPETRIFRFQVLKFMESSASYVRE